MHQMALMHIYVRRENFTTKPHLQGKYSAFALFLPWIFFSKLLPCEFFYAQLRDITKQGLVMKFAHLT